MLREKSMKPYSRILVPCDFSQSGLAAVRHASRLALSCGAEVCLLHVLPERKHDARNFEDLQVDAVQKLEQAVPADQLLQLKAKFFVIAGHAAKQIIETAIVQSSDLIVMGTRGRTGILHLALGSVAETVLRTAHCPVLTVRSEESQAESSAVSIPAAVSEDELNSAPVIDLLNRAVGLRATDIHIDPVTEDEFLVRFRIDGRLEDYCRLDRFVAIRQIQQLKVLAKIDLADPFKPKAGTVRALSRLPEIEIRLTISPVPLGEALALRLASRTNLSMPLENLGLYESAQHDIEELLRKGEGLTLVTGRTGAGKTTTVYSLLSRLASEQKNIASIEDPVEYSVSFVRQMQVDERHGLTMASGLKTLLRMDPDVVFVGEIRDRETAEMAMRAASSGRMVLSTLHTRDVAATITAIRDLHIDSRSVSANLSGIINQRLIRRLCVRCCGTFVPSDSERALFLAEGIEPPETLGCARGCEACRQIGYSGRVGIFEVAINKPAIVEAIEKGLPEASLRELIRKNGVTALRHDALRKAAEGITSLEECEELSRA